MKKIRNIWIGACIVLGLASCGNDEFPTRDTYQGSISLNVRREAPSVVRAVETADFSVMICSQVTDDVVKTYERADEVPDKVTLPVGGYYAYAHTSGQLQKIMDIPFYEGRDDFEILRNINTISTVNCRMANGGITIAYSDEFKETFADCTVAVDDGSESVIIYHASDETEFVPVTRYLHYRDNTKALYVNVIATTREQGFRSTMNFTLTKKEATEQYDGDKDYFAGGDCIVITCNPTHLETTEGSIVGIDINADIQFTEEEEDFDIDVEDFFPENDEDDTPEEKPEGDMNAIVLDLPENMVVQEGTDASKGDTYIAAEHGIKSIRVEMISTNEAMMESLATVADGFPKANFVVGAEVVGNQDMVSLFAELGQTLDVPAEGDKEYTFPIGNFFGFLTVFPGEHTFTLEVTDKKGNAKRGVLVLTINEY